MNIIDTLAEEIRTGAVTPDEALAALQANEVYVWPESDDPPTWGGAEDRGAGSSGLHHALSVVGARHLTQEFAAEIVRLRRSGHVIPS